jgi:hypothetical protein
MGTSEAAASSRINPRAFAASQSFDRPMLVRAEQIKRSERASFAFEPHHGRI